MIKAGSIYSRRTSHHRHSCADIALPTSKQHLLFLKSTSDEVDSRRESSFHNCSVKENESHGVNNRVLTKQGESFFDSLEQYERKPKEDPHVKAFISLQQIFRELKALQGLEKEKTGKKWLSDVENKLLSFEREMLKL
jgi:hypothetical protein